MKSPSNIVLNKRFNISIIIAFFAMMMPFYTLAQRKTEIKIMGAREFDYSDKTKQRTLKGDVKIKQKNVLMFCDSAIISNNSRNVRAYGNVKIKKGRKLQMNGDSLHYNSETRLAHIFGDITLKDEDQILKTTLLDYNLKTGSAQYYNGGVITNEKEKSTLKSVNGTYYSKEKIFYFSKNVEITSPEYTITSDSVIYHANRDLSYFYGNTKITNEDNVITCDRGYFDRKRKVSVFVGKARLEGQANTLQGDSIYYDQNNGDGKVFGNAMIHDTVSDVIVKGDYAYYNQKDSTSLVKGNSEFIQIFETDSLFLHADTLFTAKSKPNEKKKVFAYNHVKFYKSDMQGKCDSLVYGQADSLIQMFGDPILWSDDNQMTGNSIRIKNYDGKMDYLEIDKNAYIVSLADSNKFNQVKGRHLKAYFEKNELDRIKVNGNGETIYYGKDENEKIIGMNRLECSDMLIRLDSNQISKIHFYVQPNSILYPLKDLKEELKTFRHFQWRIAERPMRREDIHIWVPNNKK